MLIDYNQSMSACAIFPCFFLVIHVYDIYIVICEVFVSALGVLIVLGS